MLGRKIIRRPTYYNEKKFFVQAYLLRRRRDGDNLALFLSPRMEKLAGGRKLVRKAEK
jgi:hypothetical protein